MTDSSDDDLTREELPEDLSEYETVAQLLQANRGTGTTMLARRRWTGLRPTSCWSCPVSWRARWGPPTASSRVSPATGGPRRRGHDEEELYRVHVQERVEPELRFGTRSKVRSAVKDAIANSDYGYADFDSDPVATAVVGRYEGGTLTEYDERVRTVDVHVETAVPD